MKFNKITDKELNSEVRGQWQYVPDNGVPYDPNKCGQDCIQNNYWYGLGPDHVFHEHCILYGTYVSSSTWFAW